MDSVAGGTKLAANIMYHFYYGFFWGGKIKKCLQKLNIVLTL